MLWNSRGSVLVFRHFPQRPPPSQTFEGEEEADEPEEEEELEADLNLEEILNTGTNVITYASGHSFSSLLLWFVVLSF
jgi:hypothetical protein